MQLISISSRFWAQKEEKLLTKSLMNSHELNRIGVQQKNEYSGIRFLQHFKL